MSELLGGWNGFWAMVRARFVSYGGWLAGFGFFFPSLICGFELSVSQWSVRVVSGFVQIWCGLGGWWCGGGLDFAGLGGGCEILKFFSFC